MTPSPWVYRARATRTVDGDTIDVVVDVGFGIEMHHRLRLLGVNAPELHAHDREVRSAAAASKSFVEAWLQAVQLDDVKWPLIVVTDKDDVFGRWLADVWPVTMPSAPTLNASLLSSFHAVEFRR